MCYNKHFAQHLENCFVDDNLLNSRKNILTDCAKNMIVVLIY